MTTQTEVLKLALEALDFSTSPSPCVEELQDDAIAAIKEALAQPEQCTGCEGKPSSVNNPCTVCGKSQPEHDCTRSRPHEEMSKECELRTEIARLTNCLKRANAQTEHLEREWYLRGDEIERLKAQPEQERCVGCEACIDTACGRDECPKGWPKAAQPEQEPAKWMYPDALCDRSCLYVCTKAFTQFPECATTPPQRTWVGLTDEEIWKDDAIMAANSGYGATFDTLRDIVRAIEAKLKEKNTK